MGVSPSKPLVVDIKIVYCHTLPYRGGTRNTGVHKNTRETGGAYRYKGSESACIILYY